MPLSIPNTFTAGTKAKAAEVNANFDAIEALLDGTLPLTELEDGSSGQLIVCNASGVPTYRTPSGPLSVSGSDGSNQLAYSSGAQGVATSLPNAGTLATIDNCSLTPAAGTWVFIAKVRIFAGGTGELVTCQAQIQKAGAAQDVSAEDFGAAAGSQEATTLVVGPTVFTVSGDTIRLQAGQVGTDSDGTTSHGRLFGLRLV